MTPKKQWMKTRVPGSAVREHNSLMGNVYLQRKMTGEDA